MEGNAWFSIRIKMKSKKSFNIEKNSYYENSVIHMNSHFAVKCMFWYDCLLAVAIYSFVYAASNGSILQWKKKIESDYVCAQNIEQNYRSDTDIIEAKSCLEYRRPCTGKTYYHFIKYLLCEQESEHGTGDVL